MSERLQGIEAFVAAVEAGSFALAAVRLGCTRSAVSKGIARLEHRLSVRLFHRTTRSQSLTDDGQAYYERCRRALDELDAAAAMVEAGRHEPVGTLRMSMSALFGRVCVAPLLMQLARDHDGLRLDLQFSDRRVDLVEERVDLAIRSGPLDDSSTLAARLLGYQWMGLYATRGYLSAPRSPLRLAGTDGHGAQPPLRQLWPAPSCAHPLGFSYDGATGELHTHLAPARVRCDSLEVVAAGAIAGLGLARLPQWLAAQAEAAGTVVPLFSEVRPFGDALHAVWPSARALPRRTRVVIDTLAAQLPSVLGPARSLSIT
jgi:DNA-binding transcriptional LysR family regulator